MEIAWGQVHGASPERSPTASLISSDDGQVAAGLVGV